MVKKDWMKVRFEKFFEVQLLFWVGYGLFVGDIKVFFFIEYLLFLEIYDVINLIVRCVRFYSCLFIFFGLCYFGESMNKVYVFFNIYVEYYFIDIFKSILFKKIEIIYFVLFMKVILCGVVVFFLRSDLIRMICLFDFLVKYNLKSYVDGCRLLILALFYCDKFVFIEGKKVVVVD